jgi:hypothetical protein
MALLPSHLIVEVNGIRPCMPDSTESKRCMLWNQEPIRIDLRYKCNRDVSTGGGVIADLLSVTEINYILWAVLATTHISGIGAQTSSVALSCSLVSCQEGAGCASNT